MTTPTTTPVPSAQPADLAFNAEKLDEAVNTGNLTYTDRFGVQRLTLAGATARVGGVTVRGAWVTATLYNVRDLVSNAGTWYIAVTNHTSGATFTGDLAANWRVYQGVTSVDLADISTATGGAGLVGWSRTNAYGANTVGAKLNRLLQPQDYGTATPSTSFGIGEEALKVATGIGNLGVGYRAAPVLTTGQFTTALGINTLLFYTGIGFTTAGGYGAGARNLTGYNNCWWGFESGHDNGAGTDNTASGVATLHAGTNGLTPAPADPSRCTVSGSEAQKYGWGSHNTISGAGAASSAAMTTAHSMCIFGETAGQFITTSSYGVIGGRQAALTKTSGDFDNLNGFQVAYNIGASGGYNVMDGALAGFYAAGAIQCTYTGYGAGMGKVGNTGAGQNAAHGTLALGNCGDITQATAQGFRSLYNASGVGMTSVGWESGFDATTDTYGTNLGHNAGKGQAVGFTNYTNLGRGALSTGSNQITLGNSSIATLRCQVTTITALSDARDKRDIQSLADLVPDEFIDRVIPRAYRWAMRDGTDRGDALQAGVIAQELKALQDEFGLQWLNLVDETNPDRLEATPGNLLIPLIARVQSLAREVATLH